MSRIITTLTAAVVLAVLFAGTLAGADLETRYYTLVAAQLFGVIVGVVLISSLFTVIYLVAFGTLGKRLVQDRFPVFVGWTLLRSHRVAKTLRTRAAELRKDVLERPRRAALGLLLAGVALVAVGVAIEQTTVFNALAERWSAGFARTLQVGAFVLAVPSILSGIVALVRGRHIGEVPLFLSVRTAVTLPTFISIVGVSIGIWALVVVLSVMQGFESDLRSKILRTNAHIVVEPEDAAGVLGDYVALADAVSDIEGIAEVHAYAHGEVMRASTTNIAVNVVVKGMDPAALAASEQLRGRITPGDARWLDEPERMLSDRFRYPLGSATRLVEDTLDALDKEDDEPGADDGEDGADTPWGSGRARELTRVMPTALLGVELAASLNVEVGGEVQMISPDGDVGPTGLRPKLRAYRVAGIFTTGMYEYDQKLCYVSPSDAQRFFGLADDLNRLEVRLTNADETDRVQAAVDELLAAGFPGLTSTDWKERNKSLFSALALERIVMFIVLGFIVLVASLLIVSSLVMLIVEKARDIAVLKALGASNRAIVRVFLVIGGVIGTIGSLSGVTLGVLVCLVIQVVGVPLPQEYYISSLPVDLDWLQVAVVGLAGFVVCLLATVYPSLEASRMRPVEGLRHG